MRLNEAMLQRMRCPVCRTALSRDGDRLRCRGGGHLFPVVDDVPVLLNEENSLFTVEGVLKGASPPRIQPLHLRLRKRLIPSLSLNVRADRHFRDLAARLDRQARPLHVLVVGGGTKGAGIESLLGLRDVVVVDTDVKLGADRDVVCDAHDLPFQDGTFDAAIVQAVLEHVIDPSRCVAEIHRVLKDDGWVYAETPFIQQVHLQRNHYTRFTHLGHRRLFRHFVQVDSGACAGPGWRSPGPIAPSSSASSTLGGTSPGSCSGWWPTSPGSG